MIAYLLRIETWAKDEITVDVLVGSEFAQRLVEATKSIWTIGRDRIVAGYRARNKKFSIGVSFHENEREVTPKHSESSSLFHTTKFYDLC